MKKVLVTPCCKTSHYVITTEKDFSSMFRCEKCDEKWYYDQMLEVVKGYNPITFFCDKCHKSLESERATAPLAT